jgi:predicted amidohydrolase
MRKLSIGIVQIASKKLNLLYNFERSKALITKAAKKGAKIICTCECMLDGYAFNTEEFRHCPEKYSPNLNHEYIKDYCRLASNLNVVLLIGLSLREEIDERKSEKYRNAVLLIEPLKGVTGQYNKVHSTYGNFEADFYTHGTDFPVFDVHIDDSFHTRIGIMICYDRQLPEPARILAARGAEIIFNPSATDNFRRGWNTRLIQTRAYENKCFVCSVNHAWPRNTGRSFVAGPRGDVITRCFPWESIKVIKIELNQIEKKRPELRTRRPSVYQGLLEPTDII